MSQDTESNKAAARRTLEDIFPTLDEAGLAEVVDPDMVNHDAPPGAPQGLAGMAHSMRMLAAAFSERRWEIHQAIAEGDTVVLHCTFSGRHTGPFMGLAPTNRPFASRQVHLIRFQDGKGVEHWAVRDDLSFLRHVGALPSPSRRPVPADA
jgi:predicted ester cyclase